MLAATDRDSWALFVEDRERVIEGLRRGECDAVLPAARTFLDGFAKFLMDHRIVDLFGGIAEPRERHSVPAFFFCTTLLHLPLFRLHRLVDIENVLFRSPFILRTLGFNARQIADGFYATDGPRPFSAEALGDFFAETPSDVLLELQLGVVKVLRADSPEIFHEGTYAMDCFLVTCPPGRKGLPEVRLKFCVVSLRVDGRALPLVASCGPDTGEESGDVTRGRALIAALRTVLRRGDLGLLLIDRGFIDGDWIAEQAKLGTEVMIGLKSNMTAYGDLLGLANMADTSWQDVPAPKNHRDLPPQRRVALFPEITTWDACTVPLTGLVIKDQYPDGKVEWQAYVSTKDYSTSSEFYERQRWRWEEEECFMALSRYWGANDLPPMREGVARAMIYFTLLAYLLLALFRRQEGAEVSTSLPPLLFPEVELAVYSGQYYALLTASEMLTIMFDNYPTWQKRRNKILTSLRLSERKIDTS